MARRGRQPGRHPGRHLTLGREVRGNGRTEPNGAESKGRDGDKVIRTAQYVGKLNKVRTPYNEKKEREVIRGREREDDASTSYLCCFHLADLT